MMRRSQRSKDLQAALQGDGSTIQKALRKGHAWLFRGKKMNLVKEGNLPEAEVMEVHKDQIGGYFKD